MIKSTRRSLLTRALALLAAAPLARAVGTEAAPASTGYARRQELRDAIRKELDELEQLTRVVPYRKVGASYWTHDLTGLREGETVFIKDEETGELERATITSITSEYF